MGVVVPDPLLRLFQIPFVGADTCWSLFSNRLSLVPEILVSVADGKKMDVSFQVSHKISRQESTNVKV